MTLDIEEIKTINLKEGDVLAVKLPEEVTSDMLEVFRKNLKKIFPDNKCMIYTGELEFNKITKE